MIYLFKSKDIRSNLVRQLADFWCDSWPIFGATVGAGFEHILRDYECAFPISLSRFKYSNNFSRSHYEWPDREMLDISSY